MYYYHSRNRTMKRLVLFLSILTYLQADAQICNVPSGLSAVPSNDTVYLQWTNTGAVSYTVQYRVSGTTAWFNTSSLTNSYAATGLAGCSEYVFKVRSVCAVGNSVFSTTSPFSTGCTNCSVPYSVSVNSVTNNSAFVNWSSTPYGTYRVRYRPIGTTIWTTLTVNGGSITIQGLDPCTSYNWRVARLCNGVPSAYKIGPVINTTGCSDPCDQVPTPTSLGLGVTFDIHFHWVSTGAPYYRLQNRMVGTSTWTTTTLTNTGDTVPGNYMPGTCFEFRVRSECSPTDYSPYSTPVQRCAYYWIRSEETASKTNSSSTIFPNPASGHAQVEIKHSDEEPVQLVVCDVDGKFVRRQKLWLHGDHTAIELDLRDFPPGVYFVIIERLTQNEYLKLMVY